MRVSVFGLGYVGTVHCACLARDGHDVVGVDINPEKVSHIARGLSPVVEPGLAELISGAIRSGRLHSTTGVLEAVGRTEVAIVAVGTPGTADGSLDLSAVERISEQIGAALRDRATPYYVLVRSTVLPGTLRNVVLPRLARASAKRPGRDLHLVCNPEFLREGTAIEDYDHPPFTLIGCDDAEAGRVAASLYARAAGEVYYTGVETAEMVKYLCNAFHALKVTFANEAGLLARTLGVDGQQAMELVCKDTKLNISPNYLRPGFAFGGSCLPKDLQALRAVARRDGFETPLIEAVLLSNERQIRRAVDAVLALGRRPVSLLGLSFKAGTDDLRQSPLVSLAKELLAEGRDLRIYDRFVSVPSLIGANRQYIEREIQNVASLMVESLHAAVAHAEVVVVGNDAPEFHAELPKLLRAGQVVVDLVNVPALARLPRMSYQGIVW